MNQFTKMPMSADEMLAAARSETGIVLVDDAAREPLSILINSFNTDGRFTEEGAKQKHAYLMRFLKNRLRMQRDIAAHPEILEIELKPPVIISGMARTGSTKMQKVLIATGKFNWLTSWMGLNPSSHSGKPNEDVSARIAEVEGFFGWFAKASPAANSGHRMGAHEADEDSYIMMHSLVSQTMTGYAAADSYMEWYMGQNHALQFAQVRDTLKYLIWQGLADVNKPFVLKSAMSIGYEESLRSVFPDAHLVATHRNPKQVVPSSYKLVEVFRLPFSQAQGDLSGLMPALAMMNARNLEYRQAHECIYVDVDYRKLRDDATSVVKRILDHAGLDSSAETLGRVAQWTRDHPKNQDGQFTYSLEEFGLSAELVDQAFAPYLAYAASIGIDF